MVLVLRKAGRQGGEMVVVGKGGRGVSEVLERNVSKYCLRPQMAIAAAAARLWVLLGLSRSFLHPPQSRLAQQLIAFADANTPHPPIQ